MQSVAVAPAPLLTRDEVADILGITTRELRRLVLRGELAVVEIGRRRLFQPEDVRALVERRRRSYGGAVG